MTCVTCGVELPEGTARSAMSGQWLCAEHKVLAAEKSWVSAGSSDSTRIDILMSEIDALKERCAVIEATRIEDAHSIWGSLDDIDLAFNKHVGLTFWQRLRWLLLGR